MMKKKSELSDQTVIQLTDALKNNTSAVEKLEYEFDRVKQELAQLPRFKSDIRRAYLALRILSGDKWSKIREEIMNDGPTDV